jgi:hypothetical protein
MQMHFVEYQTFAMQQQQQNSGSVLWKVNSAAEGRLACPFL